MSVDIERLETEENRTGTSDDRSAAGGESASRGGRPAGDGGTGAAAPAAGSDLAGATQRVDGASADDAVDDGPAGDGAAGDDAAAGGTSIDPLAGLGEWAEEWNGIVEQSDSATPFHRAEVLATVEAYADAELHPYVGYVGQEPVGVFPVFEVEKGPISTAFSPPPDLKLTYLGPATCNLEKLSQRKRERRNRRFVEGVLEDVEDRIGPKFVNVRTSPLLGDPRPFAWNDYEATPRYTYAVDLERDLDDLLQAFSSDARSNVRTDADYELREADTATTARVVERIAERHAEQDVDFDVPPEFVADLHRRTTDDALRTLVCEHEGDLVGGLVVCSEGDVAYRWLSWADHDADVPAADLLDWRAIELASEAGRTEYDLVGANDPRLSKFKAKFAPDLRTYQALQHGTKTMTTAAGLYDRFR